MGNYRTNVNKSFLWISEIFFLTYPIISFILGRWLGMAEAREELVGGTRPVGEKSMWAGPTLKKRKIKNPFRTHKQLLIIL